MVKALSLFVTMIIFAPVFGQKMIDLYPNGLINSVDGIDLGSNVPQLFFYQPEVQVDKKVFLIIPGGGYAKVAINHEGHDVAKRLLDNGYASFVLRYRLPVDTQMLDKRVAPIQDAQSAMVFVRENAKALGIALDAVVVVGFSAGGHLASTLSTHFQTSYIGDVNKQLLRPDFSVLVYPVITMKEGITHPGSRINLIGPDVKIDDEVCFSNELNVNDNTPATFIVHTEEDSAVPIKNTLLYKEALDAHNVKSLFYRYKKGKHGFGLTNPDEEGDWFAEMLLWLKQM